MLFWADRRLDMSMVTIVDVKSLKYCLEDPRTMAAWSVGKYGHKAFLSECTSSAQAKLYPSEVADEKVSESEIVKIVDDFIASPENRSRQRRWAHLVTLLKWGEPKSGRCNFLIDSSRPDAMTKMGSRHVCVGGPAPLVLSPDDDESLRQYGCMDVGELCLYGYRDVNETVSVLNIVSYSNDSTARLLSNFAHTPFEMDGQFYGSVEGFWQSLKFPFGSQDRTRAATMYGKVAKDYGRRAPYAEEFAYNGNTIKVGSRDHRILMKRALEAKFSQNPEAMASLISTGDTVLVHSLPRDSKTIPGAVLSGMMMDIREAARLAVKQG